MARAAGGGPEPTADLGRRRIFGLLGIGLAAGMVGCCSRGFPKPGIERAVELRTLAPLLRADGVKKGLTQDIFCVDTHAHFFNASDVTVKGYLQGPVAHAAGGDAGRLMKLLAPLAEALGALAPTAKDEHEYLARLSLRADLLTAAEMEQVQAAELAQHRRHQSEQFFDLLKTPRGRPFLEEYERIRARRNAAALATGEPPMIELAKDALVQAMAVGEAPRSALERQRSLPGKGGTYAEGTLAFVGYMLSYRWANLRSYYHAFSGHDGSLGVDHVLGALVDFDRWLDCPPHSAHEDQMRLHQRMSELSQGYMLPLIGYNPWTDVAENGRSLELVKEAVEKHKFVGVKIYPPNGFRPWGNTSAQDGFGLPSHEAINARLKVFWDTCLKLGVPVMAHANHSMGKDNAHDALGGPEGWEALLDAYPGESTRVNLGHFGGDRDVNGGSWTGRMAKLMARDNGRRVFGDLGYWSELRCTVVGSERCEAAVGRLLNILNLRLGNGEAVARRIMFGSDWLMLSREPRWSEYAADLFAILKQRAPEHVENIFGANALECFPTLRRT